MIEAFLLQLGSGCLIGLLPVPATATGRAFNRFVAGLGAGILILGVGASINAHGRTTSTPVWALAIAAALVSSGLAHAGHVGGSRLPLLLAAAASVPALAIDAATAARMMGGGTPPAVARCILDALSSSWLLGSVFIAMVLGHYYLNIAGLAIEHLIRLCVIAMIAVGLRALVSGWGLILDGPEIVRPWLTGDLAAGGGMLSLIVLLQRLLFGIAGGALLTTMAWRTARINSTQSATGILYIGFIAVSVGELASRYLLFATHHPL